jgi:hypothetical protein
MSTKGTAAKRQASRWRQWRPEEAQGVLAQWRASGLPLGRFARQQGLGAERLRWWRKRLGDWSEKEEGERQALVPVVLSEPVPVVAEGRTPVVVVRMPGGMVVEVAEPSAVSAEWVAGVVSQLSRAPV